MNQEQHEAEYGRLAGVRREWLRHEDDIASWLWLRLQEWSASGKPAAVYFSAGLERAVASEIEQRVAVAARSGAGDLTQPTGGERG